MAKEKFEDRSFSGTVNIACKFDDGTVRYWNDDKAVIVQRIKSIVSEYSAQGYVLTLRQLHYQMVSQNWIVNHDTAYKKLGSILDDCRYGGIIDWNAIEDRGRRPHIPYSVEGIEDAINDTIEQYRLNRQEGQPVHVEVWTEKDALSGIFKRITDKYHVRLVVNKGYTSSSAAYNAYQRVSEAIIAGKTVKILYFGDHDPSGLDMIRDINDRLKLFLGKGRNLRCSEFSDVIEEWWKTSMHDIHSLVDSGFLSEKGFRLWNDGDTHGYDMVEQARVEWYLEDQNKFEIVPIGLTMEQIKKYDLPPNPTKLTDSRSDKYVMKFGKKCWEVDALKPQILTQIVEANIKKTIDMDIFEEVCEREAREIAQIKKMFKNKK